MKKHLLLAIVAILVFGCAGNQPKEDDFGAQLKHGKELIEKKKYLKAQTVFQSLAMKASHTDMSDEVLFYLGESYFLNEEYLLAIAEFDRLIRRMGFSPFVEKARWRVCESYVYESPKYYHDQTYTESAIDKLQEFMDDYPESEFRSDANDTILDLRNKLAEKMYESGVLYMKLGAYDSAVLVFDDLALKYYDTPLLKDSQMKKIESYCKLHDPKAAQEFYQSVKEEFNQEEKDQIEATIIEAENKMIRSSK